MSLQLPSITAPYCFFAHRAAVTSVAHQLLWVKAQRSATVEATLGDALGVVKRPPQNGSTLAIVNKLWAHGRKLQ